jgi:hypothetical protein
VRVSNLSPREKYYSYEKGNRRIDRTVIETPFRNQSQPPVQNHALCIYRYDPAENAMYYDFYTSNGSNKNTPLEELDTPTQKYKYIFDANNRLLTRLMMSSRSELVSTDNYVYSKEYLPYQRVLYLAGNPRPQLIEYTYELDPQGNWIKETAEKTMADAARTKETAATYRKISYYKN